LSMSTRSGREPGAFLAQLLGLFRASARWRGLRVRG
jgi:hypothetical protein